MELWIDQGAYSWSSIQLSPRWIITSLIKTNWLLHMIYLFLFTHCQHLQPPPRSCSIILTLCFPLTFMLSRHHTGKLSLLLHLSVLMDVDLWACYHSWHVKHGSNSQLHFTSNCESERASRPLFWRPGFGNPLEPNVPYAQRINQRIKEGIAGMGIPWLKCTNWCNLESTTTFQSIKPDNFIPAGWDPGAHFMLG